MLKFVLYYNLYFPTTMAHFQRGMQFEKIETYHFERRALFFAVDLLNYASK